MRALPAEFTPYGWAPSTEELARRAGLDPVEIVRFDGNVPARPLATSRPGALAKALADVNTYPHGGYTELEAAIAAYNGVEVENVVVGAGGDDLIMLCARAFAGPGDTVSIPPSPTYPLFRVGALLTGATIGDDDPALTYSCRPGNPFGDLPDLPDARPLAVDEAYYEYAGVTAAGLIHDDDVIVIRTFSKAFALAGARVGYALTRPEIARELRARQEPAPISTLSAALAVAALKSPPDVSWVVEERERLASELRSLGYEPLPSHANFVFVPVADPEPVYEQLLRGGCVVRVTGGGIRISVRDREDDDLLLRVLAGEEPRAERRARLVRATAETTIRVRLGLDGEGRVTVRTGAGIYDHFLEQLGFHGGLDLVVEGDGDLETGPHHTAEDTAIAVGEALDRALGDRAGIARYGSATVPMDDALADAAVDLGGRRGAEVALELDPGLARHVLESFANAARLTLHVTSKGRDEHHVAEAAFKAVGRALRAALAREGDGVPSTKGLL
ncbi:MAG: aminotransferase class I/II-fold pyridoxal phosphate-dependent enzyme [Actinobacteria bacterium]|nr:aminotransferase class I/II-fold pyridoxal phosphate-dependent enzyme [Actinomycetota bacterium]